MIKAFTPLHPNRCNLKKDVTGFTPLDPESPVLLQRGFVTGPVFQNGDERNIKLPQKEKPRSLDRGLTGFTFIEVLVSALILFIIILAIYAILNVGDRAYNEDGAFLDLQQAARQAIEAMTRELRGATITSLASDNITFNIPAAGGVRYYLSANQLRREYPAGAYKVLANNINSLQFCWWHSESSCTASRDCAGTCAAANILKVSLAASKSVKQRQLSFSMSAKVKLRNP